MEKRKEEEDPKKRPWEDLPHYLLELFLKPISEPIDRPALSLVCKSWRDFKPPTPHTCFPALVHGPTTISLFMKGGGIDEYAIRTCLGSSHGWLIIRMIKRYHHPEQLYYLLNIYTHDTIQLPVVCSYHAAEFPQICLSSAPTDPGCIILMYDISRFILFSKNSHNTKWIISECKLPHYSKPNDSICYYVFSFKGKFYALTRLGNLVAIDINLTTSPPTTNLTMLPVLNAIFQPIDGFTRICNTSTNHYDWFRNEPAWMLMLPVLIESLGKLLAVRLYRRVKHQEIRNLDVLELDFKTKSWIKAKNLPGDQVLFISLLSSFSMSGSEIGISNCIYVSDHILGKIHRYDMHNKEMIVCTDYPPAALDRDRRLWVKPPTFV